MRFDFPLFDGNAACADRTLLPIVDAAFKSPGGELAHHMRKTLCGNCDIADQCLDWAMTHREYGVWGGTSPHSRSRHGAARPRSGGHLRVTA